jgi:hypothetical protein
MKRLDLVSRFQAQLRVQSSTRPAGILRIVLSSLAMAKWGRRLGWDHLHGPAWEWGFSLVTLTSLCFMLVGYRARVATVVAGACAVTIGVFDLNNYFGWETNGSHHEATLAVAMAILALLPTGGSYSVDRWLLVRRAQRQGRRVPPEVGPMWALPLLALHVSAVYFYGGMVKSHFGYLRGDRLEQILMNKYLGSVLPRAMWFKAIILVSAVGSVVLEYSLAIGLWFRRFRWPLIAIGVVFHAAMYLTLTVYTFSMTMCILYIAFFDPWDVHRELDRLHGPVSAPGGVTTPSTPESAGRPPADQSRV